MPGPGSSGKMCRIRHCNLSNAPWSKEEDAKLLELVDAYEQGKVVSTRAPRRRRGSSVAARCLSLLLCFVLSPTVEGGGLGGGPGACQGLRVWREKTLTRATSSCRIGMRWLQACLARAAAGKCAAPGIAAVALPGATRRTPSCSSWSTNTGKGKR